MINLNLLYNGRGLMVRESETDIDFSELLLASAATPMPLLPVFPNSGTSNQGELPMQHPQLDTGQAKDQPTNLSSPPQRQSADSTPPSHSVQTESTRAIPTHKPSRLNPNVDVVSPFPNAPQSSAPLARAGLHPPNLMTQASVSLDSSAAEKPGLTPPLPSPPRSNPKQQVLPNPQPKIQELRNRKMVSTTHHHLGDTVSPKKDVSPHSPLPSPIVASKGANKPTVATQRGERKHPLEEAHQPERETHQSQRPKVLPSDTRQPPAKASHRDTETTPQLKKINETPGDAVLQAMHPTVKHEAPSPTLPTQVATRIKELLPLAEAQVVKATVVQMEIRETPLKGTRITITEKDGLIEVRLQTVTPDQRNELQQRVDHLSRHMNQHLDKSVRVVIDGPGSTDSHTQDQDQGRSQGLWILHEEEPPFDETPSAEGMRA